MLQRCTVVTRNVVFVPFFRDHHIYFEIYLVVLSFFANANATPHTHCTHVKIIAECTTVVHTGVDHLKHRTGIVPHIRYNSSVVIKSAVTFVGSTTCLFCFFKMQHLVQPRFFFGKMKPKKNHLMSSPSPRRLCCPHRLSIDQGRATKTSPT